FKCVLVGHGAAGKTTFLKWHLQQGREPIDLRYIPTLGVEVQPLAFRMSGGGSIRFNCWDCAGQEKLSGLRDGYFIGAQCGIVFFDVTDPASYEQVGRLIADVRRVAGHAAPIVVVGSKTERPDRQVLVDESLYERMRELGVLAPDGHQGYCDVSAVADVNMTEPFEELARRLTGDADLSL
ncbi:hypothetical protein EMIHUDRAFT_45900, partial [Emiliania huxleyi CCMP1516]|uniref:GTP-binding protein n=2 Tax=Emiliania huxleyi TaxID=2903 RepID=A0A0D3J175_EMIH1